MPVLLVALFPVHGSVPAVKDPAYWNVALACVIWYSSNHFRSHCPGGVPCHSPSQPMV